MDMSIRNTRQRDVIAQVFQAARAPLTVVEVLERAQEALPSLGIATVYRTVKLLCENNTIHPVLLDGDTLYELTGKGHHHHFTCLKCKEISTFFECPVNLPKGTVYGDGYIIEGHELVLYGTCPKCQDQN